MKLKVTNRQFFSAVIVVFYLIPLLVFSFYNIKNLPFHKSWTLFSFVLLFAVIATFILSLLLFYWEQSVKKIGNGPSLFLHQQPDLFPVTPYTTKVTSFDSNISVENFEDSMQGLLKIHENANEIKFIGTHVKGSQDSGEHISKLLEVKKHELENKIEENNQLKIKASQTAQDFADYKLFSEEQLKQKNLQLLTLQQMVEEQKTEMEKRQEQIYQLDTKVHDLSYEIKTLLYLNDEESFHKPASTVKEEKTLYSVFNDESYEESSDSHKNETLLENPIQTSADATALLKKCINIAQKITGANYYSNEFSRYREFAVSHYAIDQRRLFDSLRNEIGALVIVYSQKDHKLLFVNNEAKSLLGWSPEKFVVEFSSIVQGAINDWKKGLNFLPAASDSQIRILAKTKQGEEIVLNCHLGIISTGLFRNYIIGVLYPT